MTAARVDVRAGPPLTAPSSARCKPISLPESREWLINLARGLGVPEVYDQIRDKIGVRVVYGNNWSMVEHPDAHGAPMALLTWGEDWRSASGPRVRMLVQGRDRYLSTDRFLEYEAGTRGMPSAGSAAAVLSRTGQPFMAAPMTMLVYVAGRGGSWLTFAIWDVDEIAAAIARDAGLESRASLVVDVFQGAEPREIAIVRAAVVLEQVETMRENERIEEMAEAHRARVAAESEARAANARSVGSMGAGPRHAFERPTSPLPAGRQARAQWHLENSGGWMPPRSIRRSRKHKWMKFRERLDGARAMRLSDARSGRR